MSDPYRPARLLLEMRRQGVTDDAVLKAVEAVSRADFTAPDLADLAYEDCDLPIGCGQTLYSPMVAGQMLQALEMTPGAGQSVFVVGAGSGYTMALLSRLAGVVAGIDRYFTLVDGASKVLARLDPAATYRFYHGDGLGGLATGEQFDRVLITGTVDEIPPVLLEGLVTDGRLVAPAEDAGRPVVRVISGDGQERRHGLARPLTPMVPGAALRL